MTQGEIKKLEKRINAIQDPLGNGFPSLRRILQETASAKDTTELNVLQEYMDWKAKYT